MSTRLYPLFQRGNPQLRIFLPNFWMKIIRPHEPIPPYMVLFQTSIEMTEYDIKNYLQKIYKIPVVEVKATVMQGKIRKAYGKPYLIQEKNYKEALVTLPRNFTFTYPEFIKEEEEKQSHEDTKFLKEKEEISRVRKVIDVPTWFL